MKILLGLHLDGAAFPGPLQGQEAAVGVVATGPSGMLGILEQRLGTRGKVTPQAVRIAQYQQRLAAQADQRFYSQSFVADSWSTAKRLLSFRDELAMAGWSFQGAAPTRRLVDLAAVETVQKCELSHGLGERMHDMMRALAEIRDIEIEAVGIVEPVADWPPIWRKIFQLLQAQGVRFSPLETDRHCPAIDSLLNSLKLASAQGVPIQNKLPADESLVFLTAATRQESAEALAAWLDHLPQASAEKTLIIRNGGCRLLDQALHRRRLPRLGHDSRSRWREAAQTLACSLVLRWAPVNVGGLLEFLSLQRSPVPRHAALRFKKALSDAPGIGGPAWERAKQEALTAYSQMLAENSSAVSRTKLEEFRKDLAFWLESERFLPEVGMPAATAREVCLRIERWAYQTAISVKVEGDENLLATAGRMAGEVAAAITASNVEVITKAQLDRVLDAVLASGIEAPGVFTEASPWHVIDAPGQLFGPVDTIIWWNFTEPDTSVPLQPWNAKEHEWLSSQGCLLDAPRSARARIAASWRRPLRYATSRLVLVGWESDRGQTAPPHPYLDELEFLLGDTHLAVNTATLLSAPLTHFQGVDLPSFETQTQALPSSIAVWRIAEGKDWRREQESYSSMEILLRCPLAWVFKYWAKLRGADVSSLPKTNTMVGTLCHVIMETCFQRGQLTDKDNAGALALSLFDDLVEKMAAPLLERGREVEKLRYRELIGRSVERICQLLSELRLEPVETEASRSRGLPTGNTFEGKIDMLLRKQNDHASTLFWDFKWTGNSNYKREELQQGKAFQLAAYSWVLSEGKFQSPPGAFYMLAQQELFSVHWPGLPTRYSVTEDSLAETWASALSTYMERLEMLRAGKIEVTGLLGTLEDTEEADDAMLRLEPNCKWCEFITLCGATK